MPRAISFKTDRDRGAPHGAAPPTPPGIRVRTTAVREVALTRIDQGWKTECFEVGIGESNGESFAAGKIPRPAAAVGRIAQLPQDSQCDQRRTTASWCFPLPPQGGAQSQPNPAGESDQHFGRFAEAVIAAPAPHVRGQLVHCRLDTDALGPARGLPDSPLEPVQRFRRNRALDLRTVREAEPEELPFLRSRHRALCLVDLELQLSCDESLDAFHHPQTRPFTADVDIGIVRISYEAVSPVLQLAVEFIEHDVA